MTWVLGMEAFSVSPVEAFYKVTSHLFKQLLNCSAGPWLAVAEQNPSEHSASHLDTLLVTISFRSWRHPTIALYERERKTAHETNYDPLISSQSFTVRVLTLLILNRRLW